MSRLPLVDPATATGPARDLLATVQQRLGVTPNMTRAMANSPALLTGYLGLSAALATGTLPLATREQLALAVAQHNACSYCLSAHTYLATHAAKLTKHDIQAARAAQATDPTTQAALTLAATLTRTHGDLTDEELADARAAGLTDAQISEVIGHVALNVLTNYFNKATDVDIDFPVVAAGPHAA